MTTVGTTLRPKEIQTRFIFPFFFQRDEAKKAAEQLSQASTTTRDGKGVPIWECAEPPALYKEELLEHVESFLFRESARGCSYLRLSGVVANKWFNKVQAILSEPKSPKTDKQAAVQSGPEVRYTVNLAALATAEIFLSNYGVGVLSIALTPQLEELDCESAARFNYKFSQLRPQVAARLRTAHPSDNAQHWEQMPAQEREKVAPVPANDAPLSGRLGVAGGSFVLAELITDVLITPLRDLGVSAAQNQLSVYSVVRFGEEVDLEQPQIRAQLAPFLSKLSQIEEPTHAGAIAGDISVTNTILNRRHWAAGGLLGMAHILADQPEPEASFNDQRVPRVLLKYFIPYLVALLQRTSLHRTISDASKLVHAREENTIAGLSALRHQVLEFALEGYFPEVSNREVIHGYYKMAQHGLGVPASFDSASRAISDIDAQFTLDHQLTLAETMADNVAATRGLQEQMTEHLDVVAKVQTTVEWIEIFLVSVYLAHLWDMFATHIEVLHAWISYGVIASAVVGALAAALILKPWRHGKKKHRKD
jgi:hypothetical protein